MIRINLLKPALGSGPEAGRSRWGGGWISPREAGIGAFVLACGVALLFYVESRFSSPARVQPKQTKVISGQAPAPAEKTKQELAVAPLSKQQEAPAPPISVPSVNPRRAQVPVASPKRKEAPTDRTFLVSDISLLRQALGLTVLVRVGPGVRYREMKLQSPDRIVVDIPNSRLAVPPEQRQQKVNHSIVRTVRASQFQIDPAVSRIVLDVTSIPRYEIRSVPSGLEIRVLGGKP